ncbi:hypothetical protein EDC54_11178 [Samsonia erythrinae]|uniref:Uncharacterized protein n=1 Tax=Samsonia erythrinae TaxID=160434 RepID=A0A4R3VK32_9GAMM|nr:hypothetical protein EDC54_11178 [Samsonia erythrinae]
MLRGEMLMRRSLNSLDELADLHFRLYDDAVHYAAEAGEIGSLSQIW